MTTWSWILVALVLGFVLVSVGWRYASRVWQLPCPSLFAWALESRFYHRVLRTAETVACLELKPGMRVLEVGPGPGRLLIPAALQVAPGGQVVGLDIQPGMVARLQQRAAELGVGNLQAVLGDASEPHFPAGSFDVVFLCTVLGEIPRREAALARCFEYLKPGGLLSLTEIAGDPHYQSQATLLKLCQAAGFAHERTMGRPWFFTMNFRRPR